MEAVETERSKNSQQPELNEEINNEASEDDAEDHDVTEDESGSHDDKNQTGKGEKHILLHSFTRNAEQEIEEVQICNDLINRAVTTTTTTDLSHR